MRDKRDFSAYTTQQLEDTLTDGAKVRNMRPEVVARIVEITSRGEDRADVTVASIVEELEAAPDSRSPQPAGHDRLGLHGQS
jgi:hypothetical protein